MGVSSSSDADGSSIGSTYLLEDTLDLFVALITRPLSDNCLQPTLAGGRGDTRLEIRERLRRLSMLQRLKLSPHQLTPHQLPHVLGRLLSLESCLLAQPCIELRGKVNLKRHRRASTWAPQG